MAGRSSPYVMGPDLTVGIDDVHPVLQRQDESAVGGTNLQEACRKRLEEKCLPHRQVRLDLVGQQFAINGPACDRHQPRLLEICVPHAKQQRRATTAPTLVALAYDHRVTRADPGTCRSS